jgi:hypothetical protein
MVVAIGLLKDGVLEAERIFVNPVMGAVPEIRAVDMGKTFIVGRVKGIQGDKLTIERPDAGLQEIRMNESTTFQWLSEDISLLDIRVGDTICGPGELKDNVFMAKQLFLISAESAASQPHGHPK